MSFPVHDSTNSSCIATSCNHTEVSGIEFDEIHDLVGVNVQANGIINLNHWIRITNSSSIARVQVGYVFGSCFYCSDTAQLVFSLLVSDSMNGKPALHVINKTEIFTILLDLNNIHEPTRKLWVRSHLSIDFDQPLLENCFYLLFIESIFETISQEEGNWHGFPKLV